MTPELINRLTSSALARQILRFAIVGGVATVVHYSILVALVEIGHLAPTLATTIGYGVGIIVSYNLNRRFTFEAHHTPFFKTFAKFAVLYGIGAALNAAIVHVLTGAGLFYLFAQIAATAIVLFWNFLGSRFLVFR